jgi:predicted nucleic acid-binding protein
LVPLVAILDACVLYPAPLRDLLMQLALADLFHARWSDAIHEEWIRNVLKNRPDLTVEQLSRTRGLMDRSVRDGLVAEYEGLIPALALPDADDRHVLAAAIRARADVIVTYNLGDFPAATLGRHGIEARHPDAFVVDLLVRDEARVLSSVKAVRARLRKPPVTVDDYLTTLEQQALPQTVAWLRPFVGLI